MNFESCGSNGNMSPNKLWIEKSWKKSQKSKDISWHNRRWCPRICALNWNLLHYWLRSTEVIQSEIQRFLMKSYFNDLEWNSMIFSTVVFSFNVASVVNGFLAWINSVLISFRWCCISAENARKKWDTPMRVKTTHWINLNKVNNDTPWMRIVTTYINGTFQSYGSLW